VKASFTAFARGAHVTNPKVKVLTSYIGNWDDVSAGKEQALAQISRGADIIFQNADAAGLGVIQAVKEKNIMVFGSNVNQNEVAVTVMLGSVAIDFPKTFLLIAREVQAGTFRGRVISLGSKGEFVTLILNPALRARIPAAAIAASDSVGALLKAGTFHALDDVLKSADVAKPIKP
jgi:basic membrane lipoprotein Med (substrate-binding protein (PBP1-ABC) superfamily)